VVSETGSQYLYTISMPRTKTHDDEVAGAFFNRNVLELAYHVVKRKRNFNKKNVFSVDLSVVLSIMKLVYRFQFSDNSSILKLINYIVILESNLIRVLL